ncbi:hypothetical protein EDD16DRAFT_1527062 [Pisolithus croceorrhizus]|nr:hypothetical protein EDD16DRAFT_1527062 [Pisolithus croceorrhizus]KAI6141962.1 hypothetical protein EDD17DRAFT_1515956 [Pisolithus thermaeus]
MMKTTAAWITIWRGLVFVPASLEEWASVLESVVPRCMSSSLYHSDDNNSVNGHLHIVLEEWMTVSRCLPESVIGTSRYVSGAYGVLIEPRPEYAIDVEDEKQVAEFGNLIWHSRKKQSLISTEVILITSEDKHTLRAGKGAMTTKATLSHYESEIDALYESVEASTIAAIGMYTSEG